MSDPTNEAPSQEVQELLSKISPAIEAMRVEPHKNDFAIGQLVYVHKLTSESLVSYGRNAQAGHVIGLPDIAVFGVRLQEPVALISEEINTNNEINLPWDCLWSEEQYQAFCDANPAPAGE